MFDRTKQCNLSHKMIIRLNNFLYVFNLRQGAILIAVHQIALSSFVLIILLVGISRAGEMLSMLHNDMEDDADRRGLYLMAYPYNDDVLSTNNQRRFIKAQELASVTMVFLYICTILTSIYLICCISLLHGAVKNKREFAVPWILAAAIVVAFLIVAIVIGDGYPCVINLFGGHNLYYFGCALFVLTFLYAIFTVTSFALEPSNGGFEPSPLTASDERGEHLLLLDHVAHSSLLSTAQLNKLNSGTRTQFV